MIDWNLRWRLTADGCGDSNAGSPPAIGIDQSFSHKEEEEGGVRRLQFILLSGTRNPYSPHFKFVIYLAFLKKVPHMLWLLFPATFLIRKSRDCLYQVVSTHAVTTISCYFSDKKVT